MEGIIQKKQKKNEKGFSTALLLNISPFGDNFKELNEGVVPENNNYSFENDFLSVDILQGIESESPNQINKTEHVKMTEVNIETGVHDISSGMYSSENDGDNSDDGEILINQDNSHKIKEMCDGIEGTSQLSGIENKQTQILKQLEKQHLNNNSLNNQNKMHNEFGRSNPVQLCSYYDSTSKYLSHSLMDGKEKTQSSFDELNNSSSLSNKGNTNFIQKNLFNTQNNMNVPPSQVVDIPHNNYEMQNNIGRSAMNISSQLHNFYNRNINTNNKMISNEQNSLINENQFKSLSNYNNPNINQPLMQFQTNVPNNNMNNYFQLPQNQQPINSNLNTFNNNNINNMYPHLNNVKNLNMNNNFSPSFFSSNTNAFTSTNNKESKPKQNTNNKHNKKDKEEDYIIEMFGRVGWICDQCNNFNYDTRNKCNRCGVPKSPKKVTKLKRKLENKQKELLKQQQQQMKTQGNENYISNQKEQQPFQIQLLQQQQMNLNQRNINEELARNNNKKQMNQRIGDWICAQCKNMNFSFRVVCNRCQLTKKENDMINMNMLNNPNTIMNNNNSNNGFMNSNNNNVFYLQNLMDNNNCNDNMIMNQNNNLQQMRSFI